MLYSLNISLWNAKDSYISAYTSGPGHMHTSSAFKQIAKFNSNKSRLSNHFSYNLRKCEQTKLDFHFTISNRIYPSLLTSLQLVYNSLFVAARKEFVLRIVITCMQRNNKGKFLNGFYDFCPNFSCLLVYLLDGFIWHHYENLPTTFITQWNSKYMRRATIWENLAFNFSHFLFPATALEPEKIIETLSCPPPPDMLRLIKRYRKEVTSGWRSNAGGF